MPVTDDAATRELLARANPFGPGREILMARVNPFGSILLTLLGASAVGG